MMSCQFIPIWMAKIIRAEKAYESDGYSIEYTYNCQGCDNSECENWKDFN